MKNFILLFKLGLGIIASWFGFSNYQITKIDANHPPKELIATLKNFESTFTYPFSDTEQFRIEHGNDGDYFAFFKRLGTPYYFVATCKKDKTIEKIVEGHKQTIHHNAGEIAAVGCAVLRSMKTYNGQLKNAWYLCDLKVNKKFQGEHLPIKIFQKVAAMRFFQCPRGFGICMNPSSGQPKAAKIFKEHGPIPGLKTQTLNLYTFDYQQTLEYWDYITRCLKNRGYMQEHEQLNFYSTSGAKDYQIFNQQGNSHPWKLLHMKADTKGSEPMHDAVHMICAVEGTELDKDFKKIAQPSSTAQIVSFGMNDVDFNFLTSNQI